MSTSGDRIEDQVRLRLQSRLVSAGVRRGDVALEVLFWLPDSFMQEYQDLFMRALRLGDEGTGAGKDEGRLLTRQRADGKEVGEEGKNGIVLKQGEHKGASPQKKYKTEWVVKDEQALEVKKRVDRRLEGLISRVWRQVMEAEGERENAGHDEQSSWGNPRGESHGSRGGDRLGKIVERKMGDQVRRVCRDCGKLMKGEWAQCPYPHA